MSDSSLAVFSSSSEHADRSDACRTAVAASDAAAADPIESRNRARSQPPSSSSFSAALSDSSVNFRPSHDFNQLLADARDRHGTLLFADAVSLDAASRSADSLLNPHCGALASDILQYRLQPLVRAPQLVVCAAGAKNDETHALPLSAASPAKWVRFDNNFSRSSSVVLREGDLLLSGGFCHLCSLLSPRTGRWRGGPSMPANRLSHCSAPLGGASAVCGGYAGRALSSTLLLPASDAAQWAQGCEMASARFHAGGAVVAVADANAHRLLVVGGEDSNRRDLGSCELYDAIADRWSTQEACLPQPMLCLSASIAGGSAVLAVQCDDEQNTRCASFDVRSSSPCWQPMASASVARVGHAVAVVGEYSVVMLGGWDTHDQPTPTAQLYDARADRWSKRAEWLLSKKTARHCATLLD